MTPAQPGAANLHAIGVLTRSTTHDLNNCMSAIRTVARIAVTKTGALAARAQPPRAA